MRTSIERGRPFGSDDWVRRTTSRFGLEHTIRPEGRPPKLGHPVFRANDLAEQCNRPGRVISISAIPGTPIAN